MSFFLYIYNDRISLKSHLLQNKKNKKNKNKILKKKKRERENTAHEQQLHSFKGAVFQKWA